MSRTRRDVLALALFAAVIWGARPGLAGTDKIAIAIGVALARGDNPLYILMLKGIRARAQELGWEVATVSSHAGRDDKLKADQRGSGSDCARGEGESLTVELNPVTWGRTGVDKLDDYFAGKQLENQVFIPHALIDRGNVAAKLPNN